IYHIDILKELSNYKGIILCEKPFVSNEDELKMAQQFINKDQQNLILSTVIRFSLASQKLKSFIDENSLKIKRINFVWKKNRINDFRPTVGVISEIIHPLDTIQWLFNKKVNINSTIRTDSNFALDKNEYLPDSLFISGRVGEGVVTGYSSFVSLKVERFIDITLKDITSDEHYYVKLCYDSPDWFEDRLSIYKESNGKSKEVVSFNSLDIDTDYDKKLERIIFMIEPIIKKPKQYWKNYAQGSSVLELQTLLNSLCNRMHLVNKVDYGFQESDILTKDLNNFDRIG
ncbi:hypothetical protein, partial [Mammaliicoccus vitulinus]|uniref:hypothetical protein n=1 Tax=Mammaliicoccus vitulinus TaxID=71237 RepID=UPI000D1D34C2